MLRKIILLSISISLFTNIVYSESENNEELNIESLVIDQINSLNMKELELLVDEINGSSDEFLPEMNLKDFIFSNVKGEDGMDFKSIASGVIKYLFREVAVNLDILTKILFLSIICSILVNIQGSFEKNTIAELSFYVCYLILVTLSINSFLVVMKVAGNAINSMVSIMQALLPILVTLLLAIGGVTSSALLQPVILGSLSLVSTLMKNIVLPLILLSTVIGVLSNISSKIQITKLSQFIRKTILYIIGISITLFIGIMSIKGAVGSKVDGLTIRTAKFAANNFVPIVGRFLSDTMETVVGCSMVIKNAVGVFGLVLLLIAAIIPAIKIVSFILIYKFTIVIIEPIANKRIVDCLSDISKSLTLLLSTVVVVVVMFFISITIIIGTGNTTVMLR